MRPTLMFLALLLFVASPASGQNRTTLDIYVVDVEGGNAVLFVSPSGESMLVDSGNGGEGAARDAGRILAAAKDAGIQQIDHLITTHYHGDHIGGLSELASRIPIKEFIDHGANMQPGPAIDPVLVKYAELYGKAKHTVVKPGDKIAMNGLDWRIVAAAGETIKTPLPGSGDANPYCAAFTALDVAKNEDDMSVGSYVTFGRFRTAILGDLTINRQFDLMCPNARLAPVDVFLLPRHGNVISDLLLYPLHPQAGIMNNGTRKGGQPEGMKVLFGSALPMDVWEMHFSQLSGQEYTVPGMFIANLLDTPDTAIPVAPVPAPAAGPQAPPAPAHNGAAYYFKVSAKQDGEFTITNTRNGFSKAYHPATR